MKPSATTRFSTPLRRAVGVVGAVLACSCAGTPGSSRLEDRARHDVPIALCRKVLAPTDLLEGGAPTPSAYNRLIVPSFRGFETAIDPNASDCVGGPLRPQTPTPIKMEGRDVVLGNGPDTLQVAWTHLPTEGENGSPLALVRALPSEIDLYAIGRYHAPKGHARFDLARLGTTLVVAAHDDGCADVKVDRECESSLAFYVAGGGQLLPSARTPVERIQYGVMNGVGRVQYRLTTEPPVFDATSVHVKERLTVRDSGDDEVRRSEGERVFTLRDQGLVASADSIWTQVAQGLKTSAGDPAAAPTPPPSAK